MQDLPKRPRVLLLGASGQVGFEIRQVLAPFTELWSCTSPRTAHHFNSERHVTVDLMQTSAIEQIILSTRPHFLINAAAYTAVDKAETESQQNWALNAVAPNVMARCLAKVGGSMIGLSTDYVYAGEGVDPMGESEEPQPQSAYGKAKLAGDLAIQESGIAHIVLRTSWVFGAYGQNFLRTMLRLGAEREQLKIVSDQVGSPTAASSIAAFVAYIIGVAVQEGPAYFQKKTGIYHFSNQGYVSWYEYAAYIFELAREFGYPLKLKDLQPIPSSAYPTPAKRPLNSRLSLSKLKESFHWEAVTWQDAVRAHMMGRIQ